MLQLVPSNKETEYRTHDRMPSIFHRLMRQVFPASCLSSCQHFTAGNTALPREEAVLALALALRGLILASVGCVADLLEERRCEDGWTPCVGECGEVGYGPRKGDQRSFEKRKSCRPPDRGERSEPVEWRWTGQSRRTLCEQPLQLERDAGHCDLAGAEGNWRRV